MLKQNNFYWKFVYTFILFAQLVMFGMFLCRTLPASHKLVTVPPSSTIDNQLQHIVEQALNEGMETYHAKQGTVVIMDAHTGLIKALVNPALAVSNYEPGSIMKPLLIAAALDQHVITPETTFYNQNYAVIKDRNIPNATIKNPDYVTMKDVISDSLNSGAIFALSQLGGGSINKEARSTYYNYLTQRYRFGERTGIGLSEDDGYVRPPLGGHNVEFRYASMSFGVGIIVTPIQMTAAYASLVNGGVYYQPSFNPSKNPVVLTNQVISKQTSDQMKDILSYTAVRKAIPSQDDLSVGVKSGTAPIVGPDGAYKLGVDNGSFVGFFNRGNSTYVLFVRLDEPHLDDFASSAAKDVWVQISNEINAKNLYF